MSATGPAELPPSPGERKRRILSVRKIIDFKSGWLFRREWRPEMSSPALEDSSWEKVSLPHDWSIAGVFDQDSPASVRGAYLPAGTGGYRRHFTISYDPEIHYSIYFGGIYRCSEVYVNGHYAGGRKWGYISFYVDVTPFLKDGENLIAVKVDNSSQPGCRWYTGSGIYRNVSLIERSRRLFFPEWSQFAVSGTLCGGRAAVTLRYAVKNNTGALVECDVGHIVKDAEGKIVAQEISHHRISSGMRVSLSRSFSLEQAQLWSPDSPYLYTWETTLRDGARTEDSQIVRFGIRDMIFDRERGLILNGRPLKIRGACLHNDAGSLGAAGHVRSYQRQIAFLKEMGCNAVRTAHHPFDESFLDVCDEQGMLVLAEAFDEWQDPARVAPFSDGEEQFISVDYYSKIFDECHERDLSDMILRDRNHPSIFMWSIGNEVPQMGKYSGGAIAGKLQEICHNLDDSRPVTCAVVAATMNHDNLRILDICGCNYPDAAQTEELRQRHGNKPLLITECYSAQIQRPVGRYYRADEYNPCAYSRPGAADFIRRKEDMHEGIAAWKLIEEREDVMGGFIWTGWDYLGETTPYDFPAHVSFYGVFDTCGFPKDGYYFYRSQWRPEPLVHIVSSWDFQPGDPVDVRVISNCEETELFLNGRSAGCRRGGPVHCFRLKYEPGMLKAVGRRNGNAVAEDRVHTSGVPAKLRLNAEKLSPWIADGNDLQYVTVEVTDRNGSRVRSCHEKLTFTLTGPAYLKALDNGDQFSLEPYQGHSERKACAGRALCILQAGFSPGTVRLAVASGMLSEEIEIEIHPAGEEIAAK